MTAFLADCFPFLSRRAAASRSVAWSDAQTVQLIDGQTEQARSTDALFKPGCVFCDVSVHKGFRVVDEVRVEGWWFGVRKRNGDIFMT
jgi:hypothetical protein